MEIAGVVAEEDGQKDREGEKCCESIAGEEAAKMPAQVPAGVDEKRGGGEDPHCVAAVLLGEQRERPRTAKEKGRIADRGASGHPERAAAPERSESQATRMDSSRRSGSARASRWLNAMNGLVMRKAARSAEKSVGVFLAVG